MAKEERRSRGSGKDDYVPCRACGHLVRLDPRLMTTRDRDGRPLQPCSECGTPLRLRFSDIQRPNPPGEPERPRRRSLFRRR